MKRNVLFALMLSVPGLASAQRNVPAYSAPSLQGLCVTPIVNYWSAGRPDQVATTYAANAVVQVAQSMNLQQVDPKSCRLVTQVQGVHIRVGDGNILTTMLHVALPNARVTQAATLGGNAYKTDLRTQVLLTSLQDTRVFENLNESANAISTSLNTLIRQALGAKLPRP
ncbi:hypothetical protein [Deinococcus hopiensis]|uniref:Uncharacterized protein n=1 Tax=Deinococcus hopiensis KR-140 TaxID=695939 RepID=A0A1W1VAV8_9DEIO|nr:hypothetical protein [Deinococcus hopiensis]SMB90416.1 hypothetical protein SAMN00790413_00765 [Deinococcus hopiensis KR-140]